MFDVTIDDELQDLRIEFHRVQRLFQERREQLVVLGFHLMILFERMAEQLIEPAAEKIIDAHVGREQLQFIDHRRQLA